jgi:hypothetical protein
VILVVHLNFEEPVIGLVLFYGSFTLVLNSNVTCIISLYNLYHVSECLCSMSMMFRV